MSVCTLLRYTLINIILYSSYQPEVQQNEFKLNMMLVGMAVQHKNCWTATSQQINIRPHSRWNGNSQTKGCAAGYF